jgi:hypothetical protein
MTEVLRHQWTEIQSETETMTDQEADQTAETEISIGR